MKIIYGKVMDANGLPLRNADVLLKNSDFTDAAAAITDENGCYRLEVSEGYYPYMLAVRDYLECFLEHWVGNITVAEDLEINFTVDTLEIYGLTAFQIRGGAPALSIYFRPMSLGKYKNGNENICPDLDKDCIHVTVNGEPVSVGAFNMVNEFYNGFLMTGCFIMTSLPDTGLKNKSNYIEIKVEEKSSIASGYAGLYYDREIL